MCLIIWVKHLGHFRVGIYGFFFLKGTVYIFLVFVCQVISEYILNILNIML